MSEYQPTMPLFLGRHVYGVDSARRVMLPHPWRPKDRNVVFMAILWPIAKEETLLVLPPAAWQALTAKIQSTRLADERAAILERTIASTSTPLKLDKFWRLTLPEDMAAKIGITNQAEFVGRVHKFEIWAPDRYRAAEAMDKMAAAETARMIEL